jgi:hypothetical protein
MRNARAARAALALLLPTVLLLPVGSAAATPPPGVDLFETDPGTTQLTFQNPGTAIPPGFFGPGSDPFTGQVNFGGVPLETFQGKSIGDADTVVQRQPAPPGAPAGAVPIELVELSLQSVEPITVTYAGGQTPEPWSVTVSPSPSVRSQGVIFIDEAGTFDSQFQVLPLLTFTRIADGQQRALDMGSLPPEVRGALNFQQANAPWRNGCVLPALAVRGLNDGFCPGLTPGGEKKLTVEQALFASHGIYPAQPSLEHFHCYSLKRSPFRRRAVALRDQFGARRAPVPRRGELCNPARKNGEPFVNRRAHLQCYGTAGKPLNRLVAVQNQFGSQRLLVKSPRRLCLPSEKRRFRRAAPRAFPRIQTAVDHFQCYSVRDRSPLWAASPVRGVKLSDQFLGRGARIGKAFQLCAPVQKRWRGRVTPLQHPVKHLVCYTINRRNVIRRVQIRNQFERRAVLTRRSLSLCVPSNKLVLR